MADLALAFTFLLIVQLTFQAALKPKKNARKLKHAPQNIKRNYRSIYDFTQILHALESALKVESVDRLLSDKD